MANDRFPRLLFANRVATPPRMYAPSRVGSPPKIGSTLITSAPWSASSMAARGPVTIWDISRTR